MRCYANETLTCVDRYTGNSLSVNGLAFQYALYRNKLEEKLYLTVHWVQDSVTTAFTDVLQCQAGTELYDFASLDGWEDPVCVVPLQTDEIGQVTGSYMLVPKSSTIRFGSKDYQTYPLAPGSYLTLPTIRMPEIIMAANHSQAYRWTLTPGDDREGWGVTMELRYRDPGSESYETRTLFSETLHSYYILNMDSSLVGKEICFLLEYRTYEPDWNGKDKEDFVTLNRTVTPWKTVERDAAIPLPPEEIGVSLLLAGGRVTVQWPAVNDPLNAIYLYRLERAVAGTDGTPVNFLPLYKGTSCQFRDTLPGKAGTVIYRVCAMTRTNTESPWRETGILEVAQSNLYVSRGGTWVRAAGVWIGEKRASPMARVK